MEIDHNAKGDPTAMLVATAISDEVIDGKYYRVNFVPISSILETMYSDGNMTGNIHDDVKFGDVISLRIHGSQKRRIERILEKNLCVAISVRPIRGGKRARGIMLDGEGQPIVEYTFTPRKLSKYLAEEEIFWLDSVVKSHEIFVGGSGE